MTRVGNDLAEALLRRHLRLNPPRQAGLPDELAQLILAALKEAGLVRVKVELPIFSITGEDDGRRLLHNAVDLLLAQNGVTISKHGQFGGSPVDEIYHITIGNQEAQLWLMW